MNGSTWNPQLLGRNQIIRGLAAHRAATTINSMLMRRHSQRVCGAVPCICVPKKHFATEMHVKNGISL